MREKDDLEVGCFPSTRWSLVVLAKEQDSQGRRKAIEEIVRLYRPALLAHLLHHKRIQPDRAEDLLQGFVAGKIVERDLLTKADAARGRFRSFLLKSLEHYVIDELRKAAGRGEKRIDEEACEVPSPATADVFEIEWARQLLQEALRRMRVECREKDRADLWALFECRVVAPALHGSPPPPYLKLVERFGFRSAEHASNALVTAKRQFERNLVAVIAETERVTRGEDIEVEIADLCQILNRAGPAAVEYGGGQLAGPRPCGQESISAVDESNPKELSRLLRMYGTPEANWQPGEIGEILCHCLAAPASEYLRGLGPAEFAADSPSERAAVAMTLGELFQCPDAPLGLLIAVKRGARRLMGPAANDVPAEVHRLIYFAGIAAALVHHGEQISKSSPETLRVAWGRLAAESCLNEGLRSLFATARESLSK
jgi:DNA-directed RNA polymerase specialized sigma24 family protein